MPHILCPITGQVKKKNNKNKWKPPEDASFIYAAHILLVVVYLTSSIVFKILNYISNHYNMMSSNDPRDVISSKNKNGNLFGWLDDMDIWEVEAEAKTGQNQSYYTFYLRFHQVYIQAVVMRQKKNKKNRMAKPFMVKKKYITLGRAHESNERTNTPMPMEFS